MGKVLDSGTLLAQAILDGDAEHAVDLTVDLENHRVGGTINEVAAGEHVLAIVFSVRTDRGVIEVARAEHTVMVVASGTVSESFAQSDIRYTDTDGDGFTNLAELELGTAPDDPSSTPGGAGLAGSGHYLVAAKADLLGSPLVAVLEPSASSARYRVSAAPVTAGGTHSARYTVY